MDIETIKKIIKKSMDDYANDTKKKFAFHLHYHNNVLFNKQAKKYKDFISDTEKRQCEVSNKILEVEQLAKEHKELFELYKKLSEDYKNILVTQNNQLSEIKNNLAETEHLISKTESFMEWEFDDIQELEKFIVGLSKDYKMSDKEVRELKDYAISCLNLN